MNIIRVHRNLSTTRILRHSHMFSTEVTTAKIMRYETNGLPSDVLRMVTEQIPKKLNSSEVLVKITAAPINPADLNMIEGNYGIRTQLPSIGGNEGSGVVVAVGSSVKNLEVSDHIIIARQGLGTWRTHGVFNQSDLLKIPKDIPLPLASVISVNPSTAYRLLEDFEKLNPGDVIVQNGANSSVGLSIIQLANERKIKTINIIRNSNGFAENVEKLKAIGGFMVVSEDYVQTPPFRRLLSDIPKPKLGLNCIGGASATEMARLLGEKGTMVTYGGMSRRPVTIPTSLFIFKQIQLKGFWLTKWVEEHSLEERTKMLNTLFEFIRQKKTQIVFGELGF